MKRNATKGDEYQKGRKEKRKRELEKKKRRNYRRDKKQLATGRSVGVAILYNIPTSTAAI
jgi:hypothetical protein